jgi:prevent-host-death family protein
MNAIGAFDAKNTLGTLLDRVERGEEIVITRRGKPVARLVPVFTQPDPERARNALARMRIRAEALKGNRFNWAEWKQYRDEGRC